MTEKSVGRVPGTSTSISNVCIAIIIIYNMKCHDILGSLNILNVLLF